MKRIRVLTYEQLVEAELRAIDERAAEIEKLTENVKPDRPTYAYQERRTELGRLKLLRSEIEVDLVKPIELDRDGKPLSERDRALCRARARELKDHKLSQAARYEQQGDYRRAAMYRHDAIRSRHLAEYEMHWRPSLRGYTVPG